MDRARLHSLELERATLRIRLAAAALASTVLVLAPRSDQIGAAAALLGYVAAALCLRIVSVRVRSNALGVLGVALDVGFATLLAIVLPSSAGVWALFALAIGSAGLRYRVTGAAAASAASVVGYDLALAFGPGELTAAHLWPVQVLLAFGFIAAELAFVRRRDLVEHERLRAYSLAQRDLAAAPDAASLLDRLADHAVRTFGAIASSVETTDVWDEPRIDHRRGAAHRGHAIRIPLTFVPPTDLLVTFEDEHMEIGTASLRDLAADVRPVISALREREQQTRMLATLASAHEGLRRLTRDMSDDAVLAQLLTTAAEIAGPCAIVRLADGKLIAGDLDAAVARALARDVTPPRIVDARKAYGPSARTAAVVPVASGVVLVAVGARRDLDASDLDPLGAIADVAGSFAGRMRERNEAVARAEELMRHVTDLESEVRARDDTLASAVHELRNPLTSVQAYGQVMSKNLQAVQRQITQLDRLIGDLIHAPGSAARSLVLEEADLAQDARDAAQRLRVVAPDAAVNVFQSDAGPFVARVDPMRFAQVLDNVLRNAVKFSPAGARIDVEVRRDGDQVVIAVTDHGNGIPPADLERVFERYYRGAQQGRAVPGSGIGLAVSREIITTLGGRITASSEGIGRGSTFTIVLPASVSANTLTV